VDNLPLNVYIKDLESRKILVNRCEWEFLGAKSASEVLGKDDLDFQQSVAAKQSREEDLYVLQTGKSILNRETISVLKDGSTTNFLSSKIPLRDSEHQIYGLLGISMDITELKQKEKELRELIDVTSKQNKQLVNFAHIVSHILRSHAANFSMLLDLLQQEQKEDEVQRIQQMLQNASRDLMESLENLNEVVSLNTRKRSIQMKSVVLSKVLKTVQKSLQSMLETERAQILDEIPNDTRIMADPAYLESIFTNFITNAIKYKDPGRDPIIRFSTETTNGNIELSVSDNGSGIDLEKYGDKLFGMYKTFHDHPQAKGIGLYITKNQIEAMNARIDVQSTLGKGTTFKIYFNADF
jgi:PAS domain S-box-containing protein